MNLCFWTNISRQTVQTQIRLLLVEQSDQGLHCLPLHLQILSLSEFLDMLNNHVAQCRASKNHGGQVAFVFKLPVGQVISTTECVSGLELFFLLGNLAYLVVVILISLFCGVSAKKVKDTVARSSTATIMSSNMVISSPWQLSNPSNWATTPRVASCWSILGLSM